MEDKISTSVQYQFTNAYLFDLVFNSWATFNKDLTKGPRYLKQMFCLQWDRLREVLINKPNLIIKDADKFVTPKDFNITINYTKKRKIIFFFTFPDYEYNDAASKYVALALIDNLPRYFTLEYSEDTATHQRKYLVGEYMIVNREKKHKSYFFIDNDRLSYFAGVIINYLNNEV